MMGSLLRWSLSPLMVVAIAKGTSRSQWHCTTCAFCIAVPVLSISFLLFPTVAHVTHLSHLKSVVYEKTEWDLFCCCCFIHSIYFLDPFLVLLTSCRTVCRLRVSTGYYICSISLDRSKSHTEERQLCSLIILQLYYLTQILSG